MAQPVSTPVKLTAVKTADGELLSGLIVEPKGRKKAALIWVHGMASAFDTGQVMMRLVSSQLTKQGVGYFKFNNRGHHLADYGARGYVGTGFEKFRGSLKDIDAVVRYVRSRGYKRIFFAGHSTGANKIVYYAHRNPRVTKGLILLAPVSDIVGFMKDKGKDEWKEALRIAKKLVRKDPKSFMPSEYGIWSATRFLSAHQPGFVEDTFPWYNPKARWTALRSIRRPLLVLFGDKDDYLDRPVKEVIESFRTHAVRTRSFSSQAFIGAPHGFQDFQYAVSRTIVKWIQKQL